MNTFDDILWRLTIDDTIRNANKRRASNRGSCLDRTKMRWLQSIVRIVYYNNDISQFAAPWRERMPLLGCCLIVMRTYRSAIDSPGKMYSGSSRDARAYFKIQRGINSCESRLPILEVCKGRCEYHWNTINIIKMKPKTTHEINGARLPFQEQYWDKRQLWRHSSIVSMTQVHA